MMKGRHTLQVHRRAVSYCGDGSHCEGGSDGLGRCNACDDHERRDDVAVDGSPCCAIIFIFMDRIGCGTGLPDCQGLLHRKGGVDQGVKWRKAGVVDAGGVEHLRVRKGVFKACVHVGVVAARMHACGWDV